MPHAIGIKRADMTPEMKAALKVYIMKQKQKRKEEEEQDEALRNERQRLAEKKLRDQHTLEEVNMQIVQLEKKLAEFKQEKHDLFAQLKKVLHQEDEQRKRIQQIEQQRAKDASEILAKVGPAAPLPLPMLGTCGSPCDDLVSIGHQQPHIQQLPSSGIGQLQQLTPPTPLSSGASPVGSGASISVISGMASNKRQRSPSPSTPNKEPAPYSAFFSAPKRLTSSYQRSPYQSSGYGQEMHSPPGMSSQRHQQGQGSSMMGSNNPILSPGSNQMGMHYPSYLPPGVPNSSSMLAGNSAGIMQQVRGTFRPPHDIRHQHMNMNPQQRSTAPHAVPAGIPVIPPQKRMGSITSGYPVHKPAHSTTTQSLQQPQRPFFNPRGNPFPHQGHRYM